MSFMSASSSHPMRTRIMLGLGISFTRLRGQFLFRWLIFKHLQLLDREKISQVPITIIISHDQDIKAIINYQAKQKQGQPATAMFLVHQKRQSPKEATWEWYVNFQQFKDKIQEFLQQQCIVVVITTGWEECHNPPLDHHKKEVML